MSPIGDQGAAGQAGDQPEGAAGGGEDAGHQKEQTTGNREITQVPNSGNRVITAVPELDDKQANTTAKSHELPTGC